MSGCKAVIENYCNLRIICVMYVIKNLEYSISIAGYCDRKLLI